MNKVQKKRGVTILALVITIIIMLLLAGVVMQMALGDNGLIAKVSQSKIEQAKAELYETARIEYLSLKTKAISKDEEEPPVSEVLSAEGFLAKYDVNGDNITDKKGEVIDTKENLLAKLSGMEGSGSSGQTTPEIPTPQTYPEQSYPKTIDGITIYEHDKDKMILKINIKERIKIDIRENGYNPDPKNIEVEWGNGGYDIFTPDSPYSGTTTGEHEYHPGEYIMKIKGAKNFQLINKENKYDKFEITVLQWGKFEKENVTWESNRIILYSVKDIKMPEPNDVTVTYIRGTFDRIPEDLFKYKSTRKNISIFQECENLTSIPEDLYKYNTEMDTVSGAFIGCNNLKSLPENLFKYNIKLKSIIVSFLNSGIESIPEGLFKYNKELVSVNNIFQNCRKIESIPENLFKYNTLVENFESAFYGSENLKEIPESLFSNNKEVKNFNQVFQLNTKLKRIPENLFKYNTKVESFRSTFASCREIETIPENLFKHNNNAKDFSGTFSATKIQTIPWNLFANNVEAKNFNSTFAWCEKLNDIPWNLFDNNNNADEFISLFSECRALSYLNLPNRLHSLQESQYRGIFRGCTNAHNYSSIPESWKSW